MCVCVCVCVRWCLSPCSAGVGRTGTFITVDYCMEMMEGEGNVEIFNFVQQMRYKRNYMVQTAVSVCIYVCLSVCVSM